MISLLQTYKANFAAIPAITDAVSYLRAPRMLPKSLRGTDVSALVITLPYFDAAIPRGRGYPAMFASVRDYHCVFRELFDLLIPLLRDAHPGYEFFGFADASPMAEVNLAAAAGLGEVGANGLLLTAEYGSFVVIGEILSDLPADAFGVPIGAPYFEKKLCPGMDACGKCVAACPVKELDSTQKRSDRCLSAITQKKGMLSEDEAAAIRKAGCVWGCDICQLACHVNQARLANHDANPIFAAPPLPDPLTADAIDAMSEEEFNLHAWSWRGKEVVRRNVEG